jgi:hypothetical protein
MVTAVPSDGSSFPTTVERGLTAVTQCRVALLRAHRQLAEALEIAASLRGSDIQPNGNGARAWHVLGAPAAMAMLDALRDELLAGGVGDGEGEGAAAATRSLPTATMSPPGGDGVQGEFPPLAERSIVAPDAGRLHRRRLVEGRPVKENGIVAELRRGDVRVYVRSPVAGTFLSWMSAEGETVAPGRGVAWIRPTDG